MYLLLQCVRINSPKSLPSHKQNYIYITVHIQTLEKLFNCFFTLKEIHHKFSLVIRKVKHTRGHFQIKGGENQ